MDVETKSLEVKVFVHSLITQMNDWIRDHFMNRKGQVPFPAEVFAGACAGLCSAIVVNPLEIIKIRMQDVGQLFPHSKFSMLKLIRRLGFKGMYQVGIISTTNEIYFGFQNLCVCTNLMKIQ